MEDKKKILVINPGSTSTKIACYEDRREIFRRNIEHPADELVQYKTVSDQYAMRKEVIIATLRAYNFEMRQLDAIVARGGALPPLKGGAYRINTPMVERLRDRPLLEHAVNLAALIANELAQELGIRAYIYDAVCVDELADIARISGMPALPRTSMIHALNMRAVARKVAASLQRRYTDLNIIVAHIGGGITISIHTGGKMVDILSEDEGPFSPERAGRVPCRDLIDLCYSGQYDHRTMRQMLRGRGGLIAYLGTNNAIEVASRIINGDSEARLVFEAMAYQIAKGIGELATVVNGKIDAIVLTGGLAHSQMLTDWILQRVEFIAPVILVPGENELEALALGALRVLCGEEEINEYDLG